jgi:hypothetical protein
VLGSAEIMAPGILYVTSRIVNPLALSADTFCNWYEDVRFQGGKQCVCMSVCPDADDCVFFSRDIGSCPGSSCLGRCGLGCEVGKCGIT